MSTESVSASTLNQVREAVLTTYGYMIDSEANPDEIVSLREVKPGDKEAWRIEFHVDLGHRQDVSGGVFKGVDGRHYIDDTRNSRGTNVFQNVDGFFR